MSPACCLPPAAAAPRRASGLVASTNSWPSSDQGSTKDSRAKSRALATTSDSRHGCSQRARPWRGRLPSCGWPRIYRPAVWRWCPTLQQCGPLLRHRHSPGGLGHAAAMRPGWPAHGSTRRVSWVSAPMTSSRHSEPPPMSRPNGGPPPPEPLSRINGPFPWPPPSNARTSDHGQQQQAPALPHRPSQEVCLPVPCSQARLDLRLCQALAMVRVCAWAPGRTRASACAEGGGNRCTPPTGFPLPPPCSALRAARRGRRLPSLRPGACPPAGGGGGRGGGAQHAHLTHP